MDISLEVVEHLLDAGPKCSSNFAFMLSFDRTNLLCTTVVWPMIKEGFDVRFLESLFTRIGKGWRSNHKCQH